VKIVSTEKVEDCFDGSSVYRYSFDEVWTRGSIQVMGELGDLDYFPDFPRPFFRLRARSGLQVKGVEGDDACRAIFPREERERVREEFESLFEMH
jgi:hypothetical protein